MSGDRRVRVTVTFLEMTEPPRAPAPPAPAGATVRHVPHPPAELYRRLYDEVGRDWFWLDRRPLSDAELRALIHAPGIELHVLELDGEMAGYAELDFSRPGEVRLMYFGLVPRFIGKGLGRWFLRWAVDRAWSTGPRRVWVDTCTLDHPRALATYEAAGFRAFRTLEKDVTLPPD
ncbi:MAG TPA: GNAT family N-acetyltransferase [Longimicrobiales bacterium]|nr:GNAT family N-acetyltransferase [Longimicrobiales bacterium]